MLWTPPEPFLSSYFSSNDHFLPFKCIALICYLLNCLPVVTRTSFASCQFGDERQREISRKSHTSSCYQYSSPYRPPCDAMQRLMEYIYECHCKVLNLFFLLYHWNYSSNTYSTMLSLPCPALPLNVLYCSEMTNYSNLKYMWMTIHETGKLKSIQGCWDTASIAAWIDNNFSHIIFQQPVHLDRAWRHKWESVDSDDKKTESLTIPWGFIFNLQPILE